MMNFVISQYAKFVRPGFYRVSATANPQTNIDVTAYKNGSRVVIVAINEGPVLITQTFTIRGGSVNGFTPYVTSSTENCSQGSNIAVSGGIFTVTLDPSSVTTFVSD